VYVGRRGNGGGGRVTGRRVGVGKGERGEGLSPWGEVSDVDEGRSTDVRIVGRRIDPNKGGLLTSRRQRDGGGVVISQNTVTSLARVQRGACS
jgi:hypothetical protein